MLAGEGFPAIVSFEYFCIQTVGLAGIFDAIYGYAITGFQLSVLHTSGISDAIQSLYNRYLNAEVKNDCSFYVIS